jgi:hypothetical protein
LPLISSRVAHGRASESSLTRLQSDSQPRSKARVWELDHHFHDTAIAFADQSRWSLQWDSDGHAKRNTTSAVFDLAEDRYKPRSKTGISSRRDHSPTSRTRFAVNVSAASTGQGARRAGSRSSAPHGARPTAIGASCARNRGDRPMAYARG